MKESLATFRKAVNESADLQEKIKGGTDLVELGKENGHDFSEEDVKEAYEGNCELTEFELEAVSGGYEELLNSPVLKRCPVLRGFVSRGRFREYLTNLGNTLSEL